MASFFMYYQFIERTLSSLLFIKHFSSPITKYKQLIIYATKINKNSDIFHYHALKILWRKLFSNKKIPRCAMSSGDNTIIEINISLPVLP